MMNQEISLSLNLFFAIPFYTVLIMAIGLFYSFRWASLITFIASSHVIIFLMFKMFDDEVFYTEAPWFIGLTMCYFIMLIVILYFYKNKYLLKAKTNFSDYREAREKYEAMSADYRVKKFENEKKREEVNKVKKLYKGLIAMSSTLDSKQAFTECARTIGNIADFSSGKMIVYKDMKDSDGPELIDLKSGNAADKQLEENEKRILDVMKKQKDVVYENAEGTFKSGEPEEIVGGKNLIAIPIVDKRDVLGGLLFRDVEFKALNNVKILIADASLEIRKASLYEKIKELSIIDGLTGLYLRRYFMKRLNSELLRTKKTGLPLSFLMIDIDHFKRYNDTYGHLVGDILLKELASVLKDRARQGDLLGRYGGEEFCVALPDTSKDSAYKTAERMRRRMMKHDFLVQQGKMGLTISIGVASSPDDAEDAEGLIALADKALYSAKRGGRNQVFVYNS